MILFQNLEQHIVREVNFVFLFGCVAPVGAFQEGINQHCNHFQTEDILDIYQSEEINWLVTNSIMFLTQ